MDKELIDKIKSSTTIKVCNYSQSFIATSTRYKSFSFDRVSEDGIPSFEYLSWDEIFEINSKSKVFKTGTLIIEDEYADEIYELLGIKDWKDTVYTEDDIYNMATDSSEDNLNRIISLNDLDVIERLRACYTQLSNEENPKATIVVGKMINGRYSEIINGKRTTQLSVSTMKTVNPSEETKILKEENELLKKKLEDFTAMMEQFKSQMGSNNDTETVEPKVKKTTTRKTTTKVKK